MSSPAGRILYVQYTNPAAYPPLENSSRILGNAGWQVMFLGTGSLGADALSFPSHGRIQVRKISFRSAGWRQKLHYFWFSLWALGWTLRWRPDWIYASDLLACPLAWMLSFLPRVRVIYHEHDSPAATNVGLFQRLCLIARRRLAVRANMCVLPNENRAKRFAVEVRSPSRRSHKSTFVVWNCPSLEEVSDSRLGRNGADLWVLYHGTIVPSRVPIAVMEALTLLPDKVKLRVIGYETVGHKGYVGVLQETAKQLGISHRVEFQGPMPRKQLLAQCRQLDVGLALMPKLSEDINMRAMVGASNKPFDYLSSGLALLVSDLPDWRTNYVEMGYGLACDPDDPESIATALRWFLNHQVEMRAMGERGRQRIATEWNYEKEFLPILERISGRLEQ
jgi:glycosyltransferase involved in cell wall biosynthesis